MIVLDTTVLAYAVGTTHELQEPCRRLLRAVDRRWVDARTTVEVIQEFAHVRSRRRSRPDAAGLARHYAIVLAPLLRPTASDIEDGLALFQEHLTLGTFDAVLAATAIARHADALVSADGGFAAIPGVPHVHPASAELDHLLGPVRD